MTENQYRSWLKLKLKNLARAIECGRHSNRGHSNYGVRVIFARLDWIHTDARERLKNIKK